MLQRFGASDADIAKITQWLQQQGLQRRFRGARAELDRGQRNGGAGGDGVSD